MKTYFNWIQYFIMCSKCVKWKEIYILDLLLKWLKSCICNNLTFIKVVAIDQNIKSGQVKFDVKILSDFKHLYVWFFDFLLN